MWNFSKIYTWNIPRKPLRSLIFHGYSLEVEFFRGSHLVHFWWKPLRSLVFHRFFSKSEFFRGPQLVHFRWNPWGVRSFIDIFWVRNFSEVYTWYIFDETLEKFGLSSIFSKCGIFKRSILSTFRWSSWEVWSFIDISWVWNFQRSTLNTFSWKL